MGVNSLPKTVTRQRCDCDLNPGHSAPESSTLTTRLPNHPGQGVVEKIVRLGDRQTPLLRCMLCIGCTIRCASLATIDVRPTTYTSLSHRTSISVYSTMRRFIRAAWLILVYLNNPVLITVDILV